MLLCSIFFKWLLVDSNRERGSDVTAPKGSRPGQSTRCWARGCWCCPWQRPSRSPGTRSHLWTNVSTKKMSLLARHRMASRSGFGHRFASWRAPPPTRSIYWPVSEFTVGCFGCPKWLQSQFNWKRRWKVQSRWKPVPGSSSSAKATIWIPSISSSCQRRFEG